MVVKHVNGVEHKSRTWKATKTTLGALYRRSVPASARRYFQCQSQFGILSQSHCWRNFNFLPDIGCTATLTIAVCEDKNKNPSEWIFLKRPASSYCLAFTILYTRCDDCEL